MARALRPRLRRPAAHRVLDDGERGRAQAHAVGRRRRGCARRGRPHLARPAPPLALAGVRRRRELRHDARRRARRPAPAPRRSAHRPRPRVLRHGSADPGLRAGQRPALRPVPASLRERGAVPRQARGRARAVVGGGPRRRGGLCRRGLPRRAARRVAAVGRCVPPDRAPDRRADRPAPRTRRGEEPPDHRRGLLRRAAARPRPHPWPPRGARHRPDRARAARTPTSSTRASRRSSPRTRWPRTRT